MSFFAQEQLRLVRTDRISLIKKFSFSSHRFASVQWNSTRSLFTHTHSLSLFLSIDIVDKKTKPNLSVLSFFLFPEILFVVIRCVLLYLNLHSSSSFARLFSVHLPTVKNLCFLAFSFSLLSWWKISLSLFC